jgi:hypothetical protein
LLVVSLAPFEVDLDAILALPDGPEREVALRQVAVLKERVEKNPLWGFRPHAGEHERKLKAGQEFTGEESRGQVEFLEQSQRARTSRLWSRGTGSASPISGLRMLWCRRCRRSLCRRGSSSTGEGRTTGISGAGS